MRSRSGLTSATVALMSNQNAADRCGWILGEREASRTAAFLCWFLAAAFAFVAYRAMLRRRNAMMTALGVHRSAAVESTRLLGIAAARQRVDSDDRAHSRVESSRSTAVDPAEGTSYYNDNVGLFYDRPQCAVVETSAAFPVQNTPEARRRSTTRESALDVFPAIQWRGPVAGDPHIQYYALCTCTGLLFALVMLVVALRDELACDIMDMLNMLSVAPAVTLYGAIAQLLSLLAHLHLLVSHRTTIALRLARAASVLKICVALGCVLVVAITPYCFDKHCVIYGENASAAIACLLCIGCLAATVVLELDIRFVTGLTAVAMALKALLTFDSLQAAAQTHLHETLLVLIWAYSSLILVALAFVILHRH